MQVKQVRLILPLLLTLCLCCSALAQQGSRIESMELLTPNVGWATTKSHLFWTADGGAAWKDVTPKLNHKRQMISSVFFLDSSTGWALLSCGDDRNLTVDDGCFELASTTDAGQTWSILHEGIAVPFSHQQLEDGYGFSGRTWLDFADPQHGWEILDISTNSANPSAGEMLRTTDGGKTWSPTKNVPTSDHFRFITAADGWIAGGKDHELYVTHDAGDSWQGVPLPAAPGTEPNFGVDYALPVFESAHHGFLPVQYSVGPVAGPHLTTLVLFATEDGGKSWKVDRALPRLPGTFTAIAAGSVWIAAHSDATGRSGPGTKLRLYLEGPDRTVTTSTAVVSSAGHAMQLSFVSRTDGWINMSDRLLATKDSGNTYSDITPGVSHTTALENQEANTTRTGKQVSEFDYAAPQPNSGSAISTHLGFEAYNVPPATPTMSAWMSSSPYYDIGVYLQGSKNGHRDPILGSAGGSAWISAVLGQGWGLIPTWVGEQSPCACKYVSHQCVQYTYLFSSNPNSDGIAEADAAIAAAQSLGITTPIIYKDIENYYGNTALCTSSQQAAAALAVQAFVGGWGSELHLKGYLAGVYGNPTPAQNDFSKASTIPDDVWIAKTPLAGKPPQVTTWNLGLMDKLWPKSQRLHQFLINQPSPTFGGQSLNELMDDDIDNATIANANAMAKTYSSYNYSSSIIYPGAIVSSVYSINDIWDGSMINGPDQVGQVVGQYTDSSGVQHGMLVDGLVGYTPINYPGATLTVATGINNSSQIVGYWGDFERIPPRLLLGQRNLQQLLLVQLPRRYRYSAARHQRRRANCWNLRPRQFELRIPLLSWQRRRVLFHQLSGRRSNVSRRDKWGRHHRG